MCGAYGVQVHHSTHGRGMSRKVDDSQTFPLCAACHSEFHGASGHFKWWTHERRTKWQAEMVAKHTPPDDVF